MNIPEINTRMDSNFGRRKFLKLSSLGIAGLSFTQLPLSARTSREGTEIVFAFGPDDSGTIKRVIQKFNRQYKGQIKVTWQEMNRLSDQHHRQLVSDFTVDSEDIDVLGADVPWTAEFSRNEWVKELSGEFYDDYDPGDFLENTLRSAYYQYRMWGVPWFTDAGMLYYRKDLLEKSGYSSPPTTWNRLKQMAKKVKQDSGVVYGYVFQGAEYEGGVANALEFIWNAGGRVLTGNISVAGSFGQSVIDPNVITVNSESAAQGLDTARKMVLDGIAPKEVVSFQELQAMQAFLSGDAVFMRNWPYVYGVLNDPKQSSITPEQVGVAALPGETGASKRYSCQGGWNLMINANSDKNKFDAAWTFIRYVTAPEQQKFMALNGGFLPSLKKLYDDPEIVGKVPVVAAAKDIITKTRVRPITPFYTQISPRIARTFNRVLKNELTGHEAVSKLQKELQTILRKNR